MIKGGIIIMNKWKVVFLILLIVAILMYPTSTVQVQAEQVGYDTNLTTGLQGWDPGNPGYWTVLTRWMVVNGGMVGANFQHTFIRDGVNYPGFNSSQSFHWPENTLDSTTSIYYEFEYDAISDHLILLGYPTLAPWLPAMDVALNGERVKAVYELNSGISTVTLFRNGIEVASNSWSVNMSALGNKTVGFNFHLQKRQADYYAPVIETSPDLEKFVGDSVSWEEGITAHWGLTHTNTIPTLGEIKNISLLSGTDPYFSLDGVIYTHIGVKRHFFEVRDDHSLSLSTMYLGDITVSTTDRLVTVRTNLSPTLEIRYGAGANDRDGLSVGGQLYDDAPAVNICGGEDGWTNQPLDLIIDPNTIVGDFRTVLKLESVVNVAIDNAMAKRENYLVDTPATGRTISGVLTEVNDESNELSLSVTGSMKIDTVPPVASAAHNGGFSFTDDCSDALSGISTIHHNRIAIVPHGQAATPTDYNLFTSIPILPMGNYDVYVWATDKAGNETITQILNDEPLGEEVSIMKDTNQLATLHDKDCLHNDLVSLDPSCSSLSCTLGTTIQIMERSDITYELVLDNLSATRDGTGTFTDYLPKGMTITATSFTGVDSSDDVTFTYGTPETSGPYIGKIKVTGDYTIKAGSQINVSIACKASPFDQDPSVSNVISNQATNEWVIGSGATETTGVYTSNYANHELLEIPGVEAKFIKVGANDLNLGLANAEFVLYKWAGTTADYTSGNHDQDILDANLIDGIAGSDWERIKKDGETGTLSDFFVSGASGEVDLGILPSGIYTLVETKTAGGIGEFELPVGQWVIVSDHNKSDDGTPNGWKLEFSAKGDGLMPPAVIRIPGVNPGDAPTYKIINMKLFNLPMSGLGGTKGIMAIGLVLMLLTGSGYTIYSQRKNRKESNQ